MRLTARGASRASLGMALAAALAVPVPAAAQDDDARLERIEAQLRALQREVFPGGDGRFFEPEITPGNAAAPQPETAITTSALTDVLARLDAIENQLSRLTAATEVNDNALSALETRLAALERAPGLAAAAPASQPSGVMPAPSQPRPATQAANAAPAATQAQAPAAPAPAAGTGPSPQRLAAVQAILKPDTGDAGDDEYTYGFRLWEAGFYPEAQQQLALFLERYPRHPRVTFGRNLLGRAYLDAGDARTAATHFFDNYQADKQAARAADSLLFLAESMAVLNDTRRACIALAEFGDTYPALATGRLRAQYDALVGRVDCE